MSPMHPKDLQDPFASKRESVVPESWLAGDPGRRRWKIEKSRRKSPAIWCNPLVSQSFPGPSWYSCRVVSLSCASCVPYGRKYEKKGKRPRLGLMSADLCMSSFAVSLSSSFALLLHSTLVPRSILGASQMDSLNGRLDRSDHRLKTDLRRGRFMAFREHQQLPNGCQYPLSNARCPRSINSR